MSTIQLGGVVEIGLNAATPSFTDVSDWVTMVSATVSRNSITNAATYGNPYEQERAGSRKDSVTFNFVDDLSANAFRALLWDIIETDDAEMAFKVRFSDDTVGTDNPEFYGTAIVLNLDTSGDVNTERSQSQTFPVLNPGIQKRTV